MIENLKNKLPINNNIDLKEENTPFLFKKKLNLLVVNKSLKDVKISGRVRHFTPAAQEWYNSVYAYNKHYIKTLPAADVNLMKLLKSYFNQLQVKKRKKLNKKKSIILFTKKGREESTRSTIKKRLDEYFKLSSVKKDRNNKYRLFFLKKKIKKSFVSLAVRKYKYDTSLDKYIVNNFQPIAKTKEIENINESLENNKFSSENVLDDKSLLYFKKKRFKKKNRFARRWKKRKLKNLLLLGQPIKKHIKRKKKINILKTRKIFVGKGNLKHTNDKVIITFFLYNAKAMSLSYEYKREQKRLFYPNRRFKRWIGKDFENKNKKILRNKRRYNIYESLTHRFLVLLYKRHIRVLIKKYNKEMKKINRVVKVSNYLMLNSEEKLNLLTIINKSIKSFYYPRYSEYKLLASKAFIRKLKIYNKLISYNKQKYRYSFLYKFIPLIENLYRKKVVFNIVNLKKIQFSSDIYTQIISMKLRNRDNKLHKVLKAFLEKVKLKFVKRNKNLIPEKRQGIRALDSSIRDNNIKNNLISSMVKKMYANKFYRDTYYKKLLLKNAKESLVFERNFQDPLNRLILEYFNTTDFVKWSRRKKKFSLKKTLKKGWLSSIRMRKNRETLKEAYDVFTINYIISRLKQKKLRGIRVEAKGRLTRQRTAARSVFKMKYKGGLKDSVSSFRGLSATMLRGDRKANVEYSVVNSNGRNGAFGVKGWVSSK